VNAGATGTADTKTAVKLVINDRLLEAHQGDTVLEVARREGIDIPSLCHISGTAPWAACRLCLVEVEGVDKLQAACTTWVTEGMVVKTDTTRVRARRESYLKMYLSDHNSYCEAPCSHACPTHIDIPAYLAALAGGDAAGAVAIVHDELPFPGILGRICPRYCEPVCRRAQVDEPIAICALHRAAADHGGAQPLRSPVSSGKRVAVIGAGAAGLSAAWFLTASGHQVTIYDAKDKPGGALRYLIPEFRLPEKVLDCELQPLWDAGARFVPGSRLGRDVDAEMLLEAGFDAVVVSIGSSATTAPGGPSDGPLDAVDLLARVRRGDTVRLSRRVVVAGDSLTAIDAARTALRLGAAEVIVITSGQPGSEVAGSPDLDDAREEGVRFEFGSTLAEVNAPGTTVIIARDPAPAPKSAEVQANRHTGRTPRTGVFAAGDVLSGETTSVIHAVAGGKRTALAVDAWLRGIDLDKLEAAVAAYEALPYMEQLDRESEMGALGRGRGGRAPGWGGGGLPEPRPRHSSRG
jgi:formate dehydrogenase major subunit